MCTTCIFCYSTLTAQNNFDSAQACFNSFIHFYITNSATCSSVIKYELYGYNECSDWLIVTEL